MKILTCMLIYSFIAVKIDCTIINETISILSSAVSTENLISSCVVFEEGVPACSQDIESATTITNTILSKMIWSTTRTPYPADGLEAVKNLGGSSKAFAKSPRRTPRTWWWWSWWWLHNGDDTEEQEVAVKEEEAEEAAADEVEKENEKEEEEEAFHPSATVTKTIVTYVLKGCSPTKIPFELSPCSSAHGSGGVPQWSADHISSTRVVYYVPPSTAAGSNSSSSLVTSKLSDNDGDDDDDDDEDYYRAF